jgi:hypothetical protein
MNTRVCGENEFAKAAPDELPSARVFRSEQHHDNDLAFIRKMDERHASA